MSLARRALGVGSLAAVVAAATFAAPASAAPSAAGAPVQDFLADQLADLAAGAPTTVMVHGTDIDAARSAVSAAGLRLVTEFERIGVAVASGSAAQIET